ncbi:MAG: hypothetical protein ACKOXO_07710 [Cyanobium sp.]
MVFDAEGGGNRLGEQGCHQVLIDDLPEVTFIGIINKIILDKVDNGNKFGIGEGIAGTNIILEVEVDRQINNRAILMIQPVARNAKTEAFLGDFEGFFCSWLCNNGVLSDCITAAH